MRLSFPTLTIGTVDMLLMCVTQSIGGGSSFIHRDPGCWIPSRKSLIFNHHVICRMCKMWLIPLSAYPFRNWSSKTLEIPLMIFTLLPQTAKYMSYFMGNDKDLVYSRAGASLCLFLLLYSHIDCTVFVTEKTTVTHSVSHRHVECQSRSWPQRGTNIIWSHHGDNPLVKPTKPQIATNSLPGLTSREHWKLIGVKMMSLGAN